MKIFLGGTCNGSKWRDRFLEEFSLKYGGNLSRFRSTDDSRIFNFGDVEIMNPVVETGTWDSTLFDQELEYKKCSELLIYVITPLQVGLISPTEIMHDLLTKKNSKVIACYTLFDYKDGEMVSFEPSLIKNLKALFNYYGKYNNFRFIENRTDDNNFEEFVNFIRGFIDN